MPSLTLTYSSGGGDSDVGYGWSLNVVDTIERDTRGGQKVYLDTAADLYTAHGTSLIRESRGAVVFEKYGDPSGTRFELDAAANVWRVSTTDGRRLLYKPLVRQTGTDHASRTDGPVTIPGRANPKRDRDRTPVDRTLIWGLSEEEDFAGNWIRYTYERPLPGASAAFASEAFVPALTEIEYGGNRRTNVPHTIRVAIGRYMHAAPGAIADYAPDGHARSLCAATGSLYEENIPDYRFGGLLVGREGQRVWGIGIEVANCGTTDPSMVCHASSLFRFHRLVYNHNRVGCLNEGELHANLERIESFGFDPRTGDPIAAPVQAFDYYSWARELAEQRFAYGPSRPISGDADAAFRSQFPSFSTVATMNMDHLGNYADIAPGWDTDGQYALSPYWPLLNRGDCGPTNDCANTDEDANPSPVQALRDVNGDGLVDFVDSFQDNSCSRAAAGTAPLAFLGTGDGQFRLSGQLTPWMQLVSLAKPVRSSDGERQRIFCGQDTWRPTTLNRISDVGPVDVPPYFGVSFAQTRVLDLNADGFDDVLRLDGNYQLRNTTVMPTLRAPETPAFAWQTFLGVPHEGTMRPGAAFSAPWRPTSSGVGIELAKGAPEQNLAIAFALRRPGQDSAPAASYNSAELGSLIDVTGDGIVDRLAAMRIAGLRTDDSELITAPYTLVVYRGAFDGSTLSFSNQPEMFWAPEDGPFAGTAFPPSPRASFSMHGVGPDEDLYEGESYEVAAAADINGDGLVDLLTSAPKMEGFRSTTPDGRLLTQELGGGWELWLNSLTVLYGTGRGFVAVPVAYSAGDGGLPLLFLSRSHSLPDSADGGDNNLRFETVRDHLIDWNGDGRPDLVHPFDVQFGSGRGFSARLRPATAMPNPFGFGFAEYIRIGYRNINAAQQAKVRTHQVQIVDINADGRADLMALDASGYRVFTDRDMTAAPGRMRSAANGLGASTSYTYQTVASALLTSRGSPSPGWVLSTVREDRGPYAQSGAATTLRVSYENAIHRAGREWRDDGSVVSRVASLIGFEKITTETSPGYRRISYYENSSESPGQLLREEVVLPAGQTLSRVEYAYQTVAAHRPSSGSTASAAGDVELPTAVTSSEWMRDEFGNFSTPSVTRVRYVYPSNALAYGGTPEITEDDGDVDFVGDERHAEQRLALAVVRDAHGEFRRYVPTSFTGRVYDAATSSVSKIVAHTRLAYDCTGASCLSEPAPTRGLVALQRDFFDHARPTDPAYAYQTRYFYDERDFLLLHVQSPAGRVSSLCYDPSRLHLAKLRSQDGSKSLFVRDLGTGATLAAFGPVGLDTTPFLGTSALFGASQAHKEEACAEPLQQSVFGGSRRDLPKHNGASRSDSTLLTEAAYLGNGHWVATNERSYVVSDYLGGLANQTRSWVPDFSPTRHTLRLPWRIEGVAETAEPRDTNWPPPPTVDLSTRSPLRGRMYEYDGLGRLVRTYATQARDPATGAFAVTKTTDSWHSSGDGVSVASGVSTFNVRLTGGDSYGAPNAKYAWDYAVSDARGQLLYAMHSTTPEDVAALSYEYDAFGNLISQTVPSPAVRGAYVRTVASDLDDTLMPTRTEHSAGRAGRGKAFQRQVGGARHFVSQSFSGRTGAETKRIETSVDQQARTLTSKEFVSTGGSRALTTATSYDESGRVSKVTSMDGQVTTYSYDNLSRLVETARFNSESDRLNSRPIEKMNIELETFANAEREYDTVRVVVRSYNQARNETIAATVYRYDRATGWLMEIIEPALADGQSFIAYGGKKFSYYEDPSEAGYTRIKSVESAAETVVVDYDDRGMESRIERQVYVSFPEAGILAETLSVQVEEIEATGAPRVVSMHLASFPKAGTRLRYDYDAVGNLTGIFDADLPGSPALETLAYDHLGVASTRTDQRGGRKTITRDHFGDARTLTVSAPDLSRPFEQSVQRDIDSGEITTMQTRWPSGAVSNATYKYNLAGQLETATDVYPSSTYRLDMRYVCADTSRCSERIDWIDEHNMSGGDRTWRYAYAEAHDKTQLAALNDASSGTAVISFDFAANGAMNRQGGTHFASDPDGVRRSHADGGYLYSASDAALGHFSGAQASVQIGPFDVDYRSLDGSGFAASAATMRIGATRRNVARPTELEVSELDLLGNVALVRKRSGFATAAYTPYGETIAEGTSDFAREKYGYKQGRRDPAVASDYQFGARFYSPVTKLFNSRDPARFMLAGENPYTAFSSNPILFDDPTGLQSVPRAAANPSPTHVEELTRHYGAYAVRSYLNATNYRDPHILRVSEFLRMVRDGFRCHDEGVPAAAATSIGPDRDPAGARAHTAAVMDRATISRDNDPRRPWQELNAQFGAVAGVLPTGGPAAPRPPANGGVLPGASRTLSGQVPPPRPPAPPVVVMRTTGAAPVRVFRTPAPLTTSVGMTGRLQPGSSTPLGGVPITADVARRVRPIVASQIMPRPGEVSTSTAPGSQPLEGVVGDLLRARFPGQVARAGHPIEIPATAPAFGNVTYCATRLTDFDVQMSNGLVIEVKDTPRLNREQARVQEELVGRGNVIIFAPRATVGVAQNFLRDVGIPVYRTEAELVAAVARHLGIVP